jgi:hypothetical protein
MFIMASGVLARLKSLSEAEAVVLSFVRRLRMQEINTINGLRDVLEICVTAGMIKGLFCAFMVLMTAALSV